jgi:hypothetical protein
MLKSFYSFVIIIALLVFSSGAAAANAGKQFEGFWEGIDRDDGSTVQITIVCNKNGDEACWLIGRESYLNFCEIHSAGGEGWYEGTGQVAMGDRWRLEVAWKMYCRDGNTVDFTSYFIANRARKLLIFGGEGFQDITLHRVSD